MLQSLQVITVVAGLSVASAALAAEDGFLAIHMDNQKIGSEVADYWAKVAKVVVIPVEADAFMAIHMENQKIGSEVWRYWQGASLSASN